MGNVTDYSLRDSSAGVADGVESMGVTAEKSRFTPARTHPATGLFVRARDAQVRKYRRSRLAVVRWPERTPMTRETDCYRSPGDASLLTVHPYARSVPDSDWFRTLVAGEMAESADNLNDEWRHLLLKH